MRMIDIIHDKKLGHELSKDQLAFFVDGVTDGSIPDYQITALLMAIYFQGMTESEQTTLTELMAESGDVLDLSEIPGIKVDKHSTGGVGDKVSLPLAAIVAACGVPVPMISGRGLGHTGGTLDKLEAIPGYQVEISEADFIEQVKNEGLAIISATGSIAPADKRIYAIRDVTDTVDALPLAVSSIMSKKIATAADAIVLDVKTGAGAFMKTEEMAREMANALVNIAKGVGMEAVAVISDMNQPLGNKVGNTLEIEESIDVLKGKGPQDLTELTLTLASYMVLMGQKADSIEAARKLCEKTIEDGTALERFKAMVIAQGGNGDVIDDYDLMPHAKYQIAYHAKSSGKISKMSADAIGIASMMLGGGRQKADDELDYGVGIELHKKVGDAVEENDKVLTIHANQEDIGNVLALLDQNIEISENAPEFPMIYDIIQ